MNLIIILFAKYFFIFSILSGLVIVYVSKSDLRSKFVNLALFAFPLAFVLAKIASHFIYNPRPFVIEGIKPLIAHAPDNGFPSDHTLLVATIAAVILVYKPKFGILLLVLATLVGVARVGARLHHMEDIAGSILISFIATYAVYLFQSRYPKLNIIR